MGHGKFIVKWADRALFLFGEGVLFFEEVFETILWRF